MLNKRRSVALVMPVRNEEFTVAETLEAVLASSRLPDECIVADGMSTDKTVQMIKRFSNRGLKIRVVDNPSIFCGGGRNRAIEQTNCDIILISDFGNLIDPHWIENMVKPFEADPDVDAVAGMLKPWVRTEFEHCMAAIHYYDSYTLDRYSDEEKQKLIPKSVMPGGMSFGLTRKIWQKTGAFPEWLAKGQDKMFGRKMVALGAKVAIAWDAFVLHHMRSTPKQVFSQLYYYGRGNGQMRYVSSHFVKLAYFYLCFFGLIALGGVSSIFVVLAGLLMLAYVIHSGIRKVYSVAPERFRAVHTLLAPVVLWSRDAGSLLGHISGWVYWLFVPRYRQLFRDFTKNCDPGTIKTIAR